MKYKIIIGIIIIIILSLFINKGWRSIMKKKNDKLLEITYSNSGNSLGNIERTTLDIDKLIITTEYKEVHSEPLTVTTYKIEKKDTDKLITMIDEYNLLKYTNLPINNEIIALDAPTKHITFTYDNSNIGGSSREWYNISYESKIPANGLKSINKFKNYYLSLVTKDNLIESKVVKD